MNIFNMDLKDTIILPGSIQKNIIVSRKDKRFMNIDDARKMVDTLEARAAAKNENVKICARVMNCEKWYSVKGFEEDFREDKFLDYYRNKVSDNTGAKFLDIFMVQLCVCKYN